MRGTGAVPRERCEMLWRCITLVLRETIMRILAVEFHQHRIAHGLGQDGGRGNGRVRGVAIDEGPHLARQFGTAIAVYPGRLGITLSAATARCIASIVAHRMLSFSISATLASATAHATAC